MGALSRIWVKLTDFLECVGLLVDDDAAIGGNLTVGGTITAASIIGTLIPHTAPFIYTATGAESPAGFNIPFAARGGVPYVATVGLAGVANFIQLDVPAASYNDAHITVKTNGQLTAGDKLSVILIDV